MNIAPVPSFAMRLKAEEHIRDGRRGGVLAFARNRLGGCGAYEDLGGGAVFDDERRTDAPA
jgi:hypothetical protein